MRWPLLILLICLPLLFLAAGYRLPGLSPPDFAAPAPVPDGDFELAWFNTTTGGAAWERFVTGLRRCKDLTIDDSHAFPGATAIVPEVILRHPEHAAKLRVRWYKLSGEHPIQDWITKLAARDPSPLAIVGGVSSDRARDLACALEKQTTWQGPRPLLILTGATAEKVHLPDHPAEPVQNLVKIYAGRTFRFCFSNRQMSEAMLDFVWSQPSLRPQALSQVKEHDPSIFRVEWEDDPFSSDLLDQFTEVLPEVMARVQGQAKLRDRWQIPYSVGGYSQPNSREQDVAQQLLGELAQLPDQRALLVLPTVPGPARRLLRSLCDADPEISRKLVVLNGDGMGVNTILRDGDYLWPVGSLAVPLILFTHANPLGHDAELRPPSSTEDVLHTAGMITLLARAIYQPRTVPGADELAERLRNQQPGFFDADGNRKGGTGEFLLLLKPLPAPTVEVWTRSPERTWHMLKSLPLEKARP